MNHKQTLCLWTTLTLTLLFASACTSPLSTPTATPVQTPTIRPLASISGTILYESGDPFLRVYAREVNTGEVYWVNSGEGKLTYTIPNLPPGTYVVVGWFHPMGASGAYTSLDTVIAEGEDEMRACEKAIVYMELAPGKEYTGADIGCWGGNFFSLVE